MATPDCCGGKCITFSTITPPPTFIISEDMIDLAVYAAAELAAIALGEDPNWILSNQGGNFIGHVFFQQNGAIDLQDDNSRHYLSEKSEWIKDWTGWKCTRRNPVEGARDGGKGKKPMSMMKGRAVASMVGVCAEHGARVEIVIEMMD